MIGIGRMRRQVDLFEQGRVEVNWQKDICVV